MVETGEISVTKISGLRNRADGFTKALAKVQQIDYAASLGVVSRERVGECCATTTAELWMKTIRFDWLEGEC